MAWNLTDPCWKLELKAAGSYVERADKMHVFTLDHWREDHIHYRPANRLQAMTND